MAISVSKDVNFGPDDPLDMDKINTMNSNSRYLFERMPKLLFNGYGGIKKDTGVKIACGVATIPARKVNWQTVTVNFGTFFTAGSRPIIVPGLVSHQNGRVHVVMYGIQGTNYVPDYRGFVAKVATNELTATSNYFLKTMYLTWIAMGY